MIYNEIEKAKEFAVKKFEAAGLKNHFLEVYQIMEDEFGITNIEVLSAGILHDTLEDTSATFQELKEVFSEKVATLVEEVSHPKNYTKEQKIKYYEDIQHISNEAKMIKLADFTSHLRKFIGAFEGTSDYPKSTTNGYVLSIRSFLESCPDSKAKSLVFALTNKLDYYVSK